MLARHKRGEHHLGVQIVAGRDQHQVDLRVIERHLKIGGRGRNPEAFRSATRR